MEIQAGRTVPAFGRLDPRRRAVGRFALAALAGVLAAVLVPDQLGWPMSTVVGWDVFSLALLALAWSFILRSPPERTRARASADDPGRTLIWLLVLVSSTFSIFAANVALRRASTLAPHSGSVLVGLCLLAVAASWMLTHTAYTLRYAHLYYRDGEEGVGGLVFPGGEPPSDLDFAYYALTIGMCFQVSDVAVTRQTLRRATLGHALLSFAYNTAVLALALNLLFGQVG